MPCCYRFEDQIATVYEKKYSMQVEGETAFTGLSLSGVDATAKFVLTKHMSQTLLLLDLSDMENLIAFEIEYFVPRSNAEVQAIKVVKASDHFEADAEPAESNEGDHTVSATPQEAVRDSMGDIATESDIATDSPETSLRFPPCYLRELVCSGIPHGALPASPEQWTHVARLLSLDLSFIDGLDIAKVAWRELPCLLRYARYASLHHTARHGYYRNKFLAAFTAPYIPTPQLPKQISCCVQKSFLHCVD